MGRQSAIAKASRQQHGALADRQAVLDQMAPALREKFKELQNRIADQSAENVKFYHNMGKSLLEIRQHPSKYLTETQLADNLDPVELLEQAMATTRESLRKAVLFAERYDTEALHRLLRYRNPGDSKFRLHWGHVVYLLSLETEPQRVKFEELAVKDCLSPPDLHKAIMRHFGGARSRGGRPLAIPRTVNGQLNQIKSMSSLWLRRNNEVWNGPKHSVFVNLMELPPDSYTTDTLRDVQQLRQTVAEISQQAADDVKQADRVIEYIQTALDKKGEKPAASKRPGSKPTSRAAATAARLTRQRPTAR
jgi:hypothetical protein